MVGGAGARRRSAGAGGGGGGGGGSVRHRRHARARHSRRQRKTLFAAARAGAQRALRSQLRDAAAYTSRRRDSRRSRGFACTTSRRDAVGSLLAPPDRAARGETEQARPAAEMSRHRRVRARTPLAAASDGDLSSRTRAPSPSTRRRPASADRRVVKFKGAPHAGRRASIDIYPYSSYLELGSAAAYRLRALVRAVSLQREADSATSRYGAVPSNLLVRRAIAATIPRLATSHLDGGQGRKSVAEKKASTARITSSSVK